LLALTAGCTPAAQSYSIFGLGSVMQVVDYASSAALGQYTRDLVAEVQAAADVTREDSDIARFNAAADEVQVAVSRLTFDMVRYARRAYDLSEGLYDPTAYWSVDLWRFLPRKEGISRPYDRPQAEDGAYPTPDPIYIEAFRRLTDMRKIETIEQDGQYYLVKHQTATTVAGQVYYAALDLGGVAKGYVIECVKRFARDNALTKGYVSFGSSSLLLLGNRKGQAWDLSLTDPRDEAATYCTLHAKDMAVATSGDYQNYYTWQGARYCHLIDVRTGCPMQSDLVTVTVIGGDACLIDALATALTVGGLARLKAFAESDYARQNDLHFVAVYREGDQYKIYATLEVDAHISGQPQI